MNVEVNYHIRLCVSSQISRSSVMDTMDICYTRHLLSLVILSLHLYNHAIVYLGSINTQSVLCMLVLLLYSIAIFCFCLFCYFKIVFSLNHYIGGSGGMAMTLAVQMLKAFSPGDNFQLWC